MNTIKVSIISFFSTVIIAFLLLYFAELQEAEPVIIAPETTVIFPKINISQQDLLCLKQNIYYEADGEPFRGKIAVAMVTLNRKNQLNKSICQIVFEPWQFSWTISKKVNLKNIFSDDIEFAANLVLNGYNLIDELKTATYFHEAYTYPVWANEKRKIATIGNHVFYNEK